MTYALCSYVYTSAYLGREILIICMHMKDPCAPKYAQYLYVIYMVISSCGVPVTKD